MTRYTHMWPLSIMQMNIRVPIKGYSIAAVSTYLLLYCGLGIHIFSEERWSSVYLQILLTMMNNIG